MNVRTVKKEEKMNYKILKVGRGVNAPSKRFKVCRICGEKIKDFRFEHVLNDGTRHYYDVICLVEKYFEVKKKWWSKFFKI